MSTLSVDTIAWSSTTNLLPSGLRHPTHRFDFGFLPIPERLRYRPDKPFHFGVSLNVFFWVCATLVSANLYYCQPILIQLSSSFSVTYEEVSRIPTLVQAGYGIGLLTLCPMGDMLRRRGLILFLMSCSTFLTIGLAVTKNLRVFGLTSFFVGFTSISQQISLPLVADLVPPERRASAISLVTSGILLGILVARVLAGVVANFVSWRYVYWTSVCIQGVVLIASYFVLPDYPAKNRELSYFAMFHSMAKFMVKEPMVVQAVLINLAASACYTNFWVTLTFLLSGAPYHYSTMSIGLFGLLGILGVIIVPLMGRVIDRMDPWHVTLAATLLLIAFQTVQTVAGGFEVAAVIIASFGLDIARQTQQVSLATLVFRLSETARSRLNSLLLLAVFLGQVIGTTAGTTVFVNYGWRANAFLAMGWFVWQLCILLLRGPHCPRQRWIGWGKELSMRTKSGSTETIGQASFYTSDCESTTSTIQLSMLDPSVVPKGREARAY